MHRRDFLHPRQFSLTAGHILGALDAFPSVADVPRESLNDSGATLLRFSRRCMATAFAGGASLKGF